MEEIPLLIKCLMTDANLTPSKLARLAHVSVATVTRILNGKTYGSIDKVNMILKVFNCHLTARRIPNRQSDYNQETGKLRRPFDDPIEDNEEAIDKVKIYPIKIERP